jgi:hypothetical protein
MLLAREGHGHLNAGRIYKGGHTGNTAGPVAI